MWLSSNQRSDTALHYLPVTNSCNSIEEHGLMQQWKKHDTKSETELPTEEI